MNFLLAPFLLLLLFPFLPTPSLTLPPLSPPWSLPLCLSSSVPPSLSLPQFLSKKLGANPVVFGYLETTFSIAMLLGGPLFGRFGDLFGARSALVVAFSSSFLTYAVLAVANSINALFLSRVCGFMMHAMHGELASLLRNIPAPLLELLFGTFFQR